jgi:carboxyl-terminal processing protease
MVKEENNFTQGQFEGIGALMQLKDSHVVVVAPYDGSPAQKAGLKPGDILLKVNGEDISGQPLSQVVGKFSDRPALPSPSPSRIPSPGKPAI